MIIFGAHVQKDGISNNFFLFYENSYFSEFFFFFFFLGQKGGKRVVKGQKMTQNYRFQSTRLYISWTVDHIIKIFSTQF